MALYLGCMGGLGVWMCTGTVCESSRPVFDGEWSRRKAANTAYVLLERWVQRWSVGLIVGEGEGKRGKRGSRLGWEPVTNKLYRVLLSCPAKDVNDAADDAAAVVTKRIDRSEQTEHHVRACVARERDTQRIRATHWRWCSGQGAWMRTRHIKPLSQTKSTVKHKSKDHYAQITY